jgi:Polyketide cyclase / dehydrase and lipid transport
MTRTVGSEQTTLTATNGWSECSTAALLAGEILLQTRSHSAWGGAVMAQMYLPLERSRVWSQVTDYPRWVHYFPDVIRSEVVGCGAGLSQGKKRLYQVARKAFFLFSAQVEIYLHVLETTPAANQQQIQFQMEKGSFTDFSAELNLQDYQSGTLLTYAVQATPAIPVPTILVQEGMRLDLPTNMRQMRQVICC